MVLTRKKNQPNWKLLSHLDDFDQDIIIGNNASDRQENATVNENNSDQEFSVGNPSSSLTANENAVSVENVARWKDWLRKW